jgi:hypothetical protein
MSLDSATRSHTLQWRAFVGPHFVRADAATFFDWSTLTADAAYEPVPAATTLAGALAAAATSATLTTTTNFPAGGGVWIGPIWEYVGYAGATGGTLGNLVRETVDTEQTGNHANGAAVRFWWPLTTATKLTLNEKLDGALGALDWQATIAGDNAPQAALRNGHLVLIQTRYEVKGDTVWSSWANFLVGWLQSPTIRQGANGETPWEATIVSSAGMLQSIQAQGLRVGPVNAARGGSISGSTAVAAWYKAAAQGEFTGSNVALGPEQAVDGARATLYASERYLGTENKPSLTFPFQQEIYEVHISTYLGQGRGYRWFQVISDGMPNFRFVNAAGYAITPAADVAANDVIVFCENEALFRFENPACMAAVVQCDESTGIGYCDGSVGVTTLVSAGSYSVADWWDSLAPAAGALYYYGNSGATERFHGGILWGTVDAGAVAAEWGGQYNWTGANIAAPGTGATIRRYFANSKDAATGYTVDDVSNPGTFIGDGHRFYLLLQINGMGLTLTDTITDSAPDTAATLYISLGDTGCVDGLDASGTLQIGNEQITYSAKTMDNRGLVVTARGANGTAKAAHLAGETIYQVEDGLATDTLPLASVVLRRTSGKAYLTDFKLYGARSLQTPRVPNEDEPDDPASDVTWTQDYELFATVTGHNSATYTYAGTPAQRRYRWLLLVVTAMTTNPYRLMVNELEVVTKGDIYSAATYLASGTVYEAVDAILDGCGIPDAARVDGTGTPTVSGYTTAPDMAWQVCADLADMTGCFIEVGRDSKMTVKVHPYFGGTPAIATTWSKTLATSYAPDWPWGRAIGQIELPWLALDGSGGGTVKYPATPDAFGMIAKLEQLRFADAAAALVVAEKKYWLARLPFGAVIEAAGAPLAARPGVAHSVAWQLDSAMLAMARTYLLDNVTHRLENHMLTTVVHGVQINREDER